MTNGNFSRRIGLAVAAVLLAGGPAFAGNGEQAAAGLPGVKADAGIVKPAPEPEPETLPAGDADDTYFKVGDTEVRIGGYIRVDIGMGPLGARRHR